MEQALRIDCSVLEGGGQIIRNSLAYSVLLDRNVHLANIRHNRPKPGLAQQHLVVTSLMKNISNAELFGAELLSTSVDFHPNVHLSQAKSSPTINCDIKSAGAASLVVQAALPCVLLNKLSKTDFGGFSTMQVHIKGGTNVPFSPPLDHFKHVISPILRMMGLQTSMQISRRGFYPIGCGKLVLSADVAECIKPLKIVQLGKALRLNGVYYGTGNHFTQEVIDEFITLSRAELGHFLASRNMSAVQEYLSSSPLFEGADNSLVAEQNNTPAPANKKQRSNHSTFGAQLWLTTESGVPVSANVLFEGKKSDYFDPQLASRQLVAQLAWVLDSGACLDEHTADQLILYMAMAASSPLGEGVSREDKTSEVLCAPRCEADLSAPSSGTDSAITSLLHPSSLHIEAAIHIAKLFTNCEITMEEDPVSKCRKITVAPPR